MTMITTFSSDEETEARIEVERMRLEELMPGSRVTRAFPRRTARTAERHTDSMPGGLQDPSEAGGL